MPKQASCHCHALSVIFYIPALWVSAYYVLLTELMLASETEFLKQTCMYTLLQPPSKLPSAGNLCFQK